uniref:Uncharacterized protein n=1 Tax=Oryza meridionalis TaxID=40149 RepID=A0A0E0D2J0_9ORYZ
MARPTSLTAPDPLHFRADIGPQCLVLCLAAAAANTELEEEGATTRKEALCPHKQELLILDLR